MAVARNYEMHLLEEFMEDHGSSGEYIREALLREVKTMPPNEDSGVHELLSDPRYVALQVGDLDRRLSHDIKQLESRVQRHREELTANHNALGSRLGNATEANKTELHALQVWKAGAEKDLAEFQMWKGLMIKLMLFIIAASFGGGAAAMKVLGGP